jgi:hypothetical protein
MDAQTAQLLLYAIAAVGAIVWLIGLRRTGSAGAHARPQSALSGRVLILGKVMQRLFSGRRYGGPILPQAAVPAAAKRVVSLS